MPGFGNVYEQHQEQSQQQHIWTKPDGSDQLHAVHYSNMFEDHEHQNPDYHLAPCIKNAQEDSPSGLILTRQQIKEHNRKVGWQQWITLKGNVYHTTGFRDHFIAYNMRKAAENRQERESSATSNITPTDHHHQGHTCKSPLQAYDCSALHTLDDQVFQCETYKETQETEVRDNIQSSEDDEFTDEDDDEQNEETEDDEYIDCDEVEYDVKNKYSVPDFLWQYDVLAALRKSGLSLSEIETEIAPFKIGVLQNRVLPRWKYWQSIRTDVIALSDDLANRGNDISEYEQEYLAVLQRWLRSYQEIDPVEKHPMGDGNTNVFFLTQDPDALRDWTRTLPPLDMELPKSGAWNSSEMLLSPLVNTHDVFSAALRAHHSDDKEFSHDIQGDVAWRELPLNVITNDEMTPNQQMIHDARVQRGPLNSERMKKKRACLGLYFSKKYKFSEEKMKKFLQWADLMEQNQKELHALCSDDNA